MYVLNHILTSESWVKPLLPVRGGFCARARVCFKCVRGGV